MAILFVLASAGIARAQQPLVDVLSFLLVNRTVSTGDFTRDQQAAAATRDAISAFVLSELSTRPVASPAGGFNYRLDPALGTAVRASESFGPFFVERTLTAGRGRGSFGLNYTQASFGNMDGRELRDGSLIALASRFSGETTPFDAESVTLELRTRATTATGYFGITDRLDIGGAVPFVNVSLRGTRVDTYRGAASVQATAAASASGLGDIVFRAKYRLLSRGNESLAVIGETRLPTGDSRNLLGGGRMVFIPRAVASLERGRLDAHGNFAYAFGAGTQEIDYAGAATFAVSPRLTLIGEMLGRRFGQGGRLVEISAPHPTLAGVETLRLSGVSEATNRIAIVTGFRWNVATKWILSANVLRPLTTAGLNAGWVPTLMFDYSPGG
jgi:hypothetical protein